MSQRMKEPIQEPEQQREQLLREIEQLARRALFGSISETYRTCGTRGCGCHRDGPKHGPHLYVSYRGDKGKTTGYYRQSGPTKCTTKVPTRHSWDKPYLAVLHGDALRCCRRLAGRSFSHASSHSAGKMPAAR